MHLEMETADGVEHSPALEEHLRGRLERIDRRFGDRITRIEAYFKDERPGKGGVDKHCRLEARLAGTDPVLAEALQENVYDAATAAAEKLETVIDRHLARRARD